MGVPLAGDLGGVLSAALAECVAGHGSVILTGGAAGAGKTHALHDLARQARNRGVTTLVAGAGGAGQSAPLGLLRRLFVGGDLRGEALALLDGGSDADSFVADLPADELPPRTRRGLADLVLGLAAVTPVLIGVDDVDFADAGSLQLLLYLVRRLDRAPILMVLTESAGRRALDPRFRAEVLSLPYCRRLRLRPFDADAVADLLAGRDGGAPAPHDLVADHLQVSGGSPQLLAALLDDRHDAGGGPVVAGEAFGRAVLTCLHRSGPRLVKLVRAAAVLDNQEDLPVLAEMLGTDIWSATQTMHEAEDTGLLTDGRFRHQRARATVLESMLPDELAAMHDRAAVVLHEHNAPAIAVARQLVAARRLLETMPAGEPWRVPLLVSAARQPEERDGARFAVECLRLADEWCTVDDERVGIQLQLMRAHWRTDPAGSRASLTALSTAARQGRLTGRAALEVVLCLLWFGLVEDAVEIFDWIVATSITADAPDTVMALYSAVAQLHYLYPEVSKPTEAEAEPPQSRIALPTLRRAYQQAVMVVETLLHAGPERLVADAERILRLPLDETTFGPVWFSLELLLLAERLDRAAYWCDILRKSARARRTSTWLALFSAVRATISLRQGDLAEAEQDGRRALTLLPADGWGVMIGLPLSALCLAYTRRGAHSDVAALLRIPVPEAMFRTPIGLQYLRARGHHHLALGNAQEAVADFEHCRDLCQRWRRDMPAWLPWRGDLAEARLALGDRVRAAELAQEQLSRLGPDNSRTRGITTRILAAASHPPDRPALLRASIEILQASGDRLELVRAYAELSEALRNLGDETQARLTMRTFERFNTAGDTPAPAADVAGPGPNELSDAEHRVATLAVQGCTNRQIAQQLNVTISTVEQHLTRIYRKLGVRGRTELLDMPLDRLRPA